MSPKLNVVEISDGIWRIWFGDYWTKGSHYVGGDFKTSEKAHGYLSQNPVLDPQDGQKYYVYREKDDLVAPVTGWDNNNLSCQKLLTWSRLFRTKAEAEHAQAAE
jgi:hypothetical protein